QAEDGIRDPLVTGVQTCALPIFASHAAAQRKEPVLMREAVGVKSYPAAPRLAESVAMVAASALPAAEMTVPEEIVAIREWNAAEIGRASCRERGEIPGVGGGGTA